MHEDGPTGTLNWTALRTISSIAQVCQNRKKGHQRRLFLWTLRYRATPGIERRSSGTNYTGPPQAQKTGPFRAGFSFLFFITFFSFLLLSSTNFFLNAFLISSLLILFPSESRPICRLKADLRISRLILLLSPPEIDKITPLGVFFFGVSTALKIGM